ncbi:CopD family protein [Pseudobacter ginsenosidimutans]|uniref:Protoporphyrinogen IX oxidase n=1 Tax=Pseudobacter ginsenosidimutans TaxID=661488 RepID=A0A4Q7MRE5_9BACT|nr:CopD family protein [Pseudobacter ginsenosidimutans]QEC41864.1 protoporphyrinogen IX oxidase [Pseudobacter ginsenosidimutans]RZS71316.1 putative membrane protein [Pseudobacter ginsenosidimutans]
MYLYIKALHIIFVVTWFAGLFYMPRLMVYNAEAGAQPEPARDILRNQYNIMMKRLWFGITWPSAVLTLILGLSAWYQLGVFPDWLKIKLLFVIGLFFYHGSLHVIAKQQWKGNFKYSGQQLRIWNEVATIFLVAIVMLVVVKENMSVVWGLLGLILFVVLLMSAIKIYKLVRMKK